MIKIRSSFKALNIVCGAFLLMMSSATMAQAQVEQTKESYMKDCQHTRNKAYCACHFDVVMNLTQQHEKRYISKIIDKAEAERLRIFNQLKGFTGVTEANLKEVCDQTSQYWDLMSELNALGAQRTPEAHARKKVVAQAATQAMPEAEEIYMAYKKSHGMIVNHRGHTYDEAGLSLSTDVLRSYCKPLSDLKAENAKLNAPTRIPRYKSFLIKKSPDARKCDALRTVNPR